MSSIIATQNGTPRELTPAGNFIARCYQMIHIGTIEDTFKGEKKIFNKVRIGWELPTETKVFNAEKGEEPFVISKEFSLSMNEKANLRKMLESWRGKGFSEEEAKAFDITKLIGAACMINIIHKPKASDPNTLYAEIATVSPMPKGFPCPPQINDTIIWAYDTPDMNVFEKLPDFLKEKIKTSAEWEKLGGKPTQAPEPITADADDLPF